MQFMFLLNYDKNFGIPLIGILWFRVQRSTDKTFSNTINHKNTNNNETIFEHSSVVEWKFAFKIHTNVLFTSFSLIFINLQVKTVIYKAKEQTNELTNGQMKQVANKWMNKPRQKASQIQICYGGVEERSESLVMNGFYIFKR